MKDYKKEWLSKAEIDYFAPFISLWLACNSWYRSHYSDLPSQDRELINKIKTDFSRRNHLFRNFDNTLINDIGRKNISLKYNLEMLHYSLENAELKPENLQRKCSFLNFLNDYSKKNDISAYNSIIKNPTILASGEVSAKEISDVLLLDKIYISSNTEEVFSGLFETIYQIRNMVIHGHIAPNKDEHEVVKYCYFILLAMMGE